MDFNSIEEKMKKTISVFEENLSEVRAGRANPNILNKVMVDYYGVPRLDTDMEFDSSKYSKDTPILNLSYKDILVSAASNVRSTKGQTDPYCIQMTEDGPVIMERIGTSYQPMQGFLRKGQSEDQNHYLERVNNERSYFVLG